MYQGWQGQQLTTSDLTLIFIPQLGGRLMQVAFNGHPYLFVNPRYAGKYISPEEAKGGWINYGGDKIWPLPEGDQDDHHWVLASTALDDLPYAFRVVEQGTRCTVELTGQPDSITGLQYIRTISVSPGSPEIRFHVVMRNSTAHPIAWSVQSVTQYDLGDPGHPSSFNHNFHAFTPVNPASTYPGSYHVRSGLADDPSFSVKDGLFHLHWLPFSNEVWLDSAAGWIAVVDRTSTYGMIERFTAFPQPLYPDRASVIFYKNGDSVHFDKEGMANIPASVGDSTLHYMEAELNSPLVNLDPGQSYAWDTRWNPVRIDRAPLGITPAGVITNSLRVAPGASPSQIQLTAHLSVFRPGQLTAVLFNVQGREIERVPLASVTPRDQVDLQEKEVTYTSPADSVRLVLTGSDGKDYGTLGSAAIPRATTIPRPIH